MGHPDVKLIEQAPDGTLLPGEEASASSMTAASMRCS